MAFDFGLENKLIFFFFFFFVLFLFLFSRSVFIFQIESVHFISSIPSILIFKFFTRCVADWCNYFGLAPELLLIYCAPKMPQQERNKKDTNREKSQK